MAEREFVQTYVSRGDKTYRLTTSKEVTRKINEVIQIDLESDKIILRMMASPQIRQVEAQYIKPFLLDARASPQKAFTFQPLGIAKPVESDPKPVENNVTHYAQGTIQQNAYEKSYGNNYDSYSEHLSSLHLKLYKETERIRKWKITTEMDIQQKEKKLQDSLQIIESQRKSLLEVQLENEKLSLRLSEEIENRQEILEKISATRDLCFVAKNHMDRLEEKISSCETTRVVIDNRNAKILVDFEDLLKKYDELYCKHEDTVKKLNSLIQCEKEEKESLSKSYVSQLNDSTRELESMSDALNKKEMNIDSLQKEVDKCKANLAKLLKQKDSLQTEVQESKSLCESKIDEVSSLKREIHNLQDKNNRLKISLEDSENLVEKFKLSKSTLKQELNDSNLQLEREDAAHKKEISDFKCLLEEEKLRNAEFGIILHEKDNQIQELTEAKNIIETKVTEQGKELEKLNDEFNDTKQSLERSQQEAQNSLQDLISTNDKLNENRLQLESLQLSIKKQKEEENDMKKKYNLDINSLKDNLKEKQSENEKLQSENTAIQECLKIKTTSIKGLQKQVKSLRKEIVSKTKAINQSKTELKDNLNKSNEETEILNTEINVLKQQIISKGEEFEKEKEVLKGLHNSRMKEILQILDKTEDDYHKAMLAKEEEIHKLRNEVTKFNEEVRNEKNREAEINRLQSEKDKLQIQVEDIQESNNAKIKELKNENYDLQIQLDSLKKNKEKEMQQLQDERDNFQKQLQSHKENIPAYDYIYMLQKQSPSPNIMHCTVKRPPITVVHPESHKDFQTYSPNIKREPHHKKLKTWPEDRKSSQEDVASVLMKPKQRKFFKTSRAVKKNTNKDGLLWFDLEESYIENN